MDIHCGGVDNKFPHHTNEIAQTESYIGHKWCKYWFHVEHLNTKTGKMSKSAGNFLTLSKLEELGYQPLVYKYFCLQSHYRNQLTFSTDALDSAKNSYEKLAKKISMLKQNDGTIDNAVFESCKEQFADALANDLNTAQALTSLFDVLKLDTNDATKIALIKSFDSVLQLDFAKMIGAGPGQKEPELDDETKQKVESLIEERKQAKAKKDFALADKIRAELSQMGIELIDSKQGTTYKVKK